MYFPLIVLEKRLAVLSPDERELMLTLCQQITAEHDAEKFLRLVTQLNNLLERTQTRLAIPAGSTRGTASSESRGS
jgi:hypothetical protein